MKTLKQWQASKKYLTDFLQEGDQIDEWLADYFIECLPPITHKFNIRQIGEPYSIDNNGHETFITIVRPNIEGPWIYAGIKPEPRNIKA